MSNGQRLKIVVRSESEILEQGTFRNGLHHRQTDVLCLGLEFSELQSWSKEQKLQCSAGAGSGAIISFVGHARTSHIFRVPWLL